MQHWMPPMPTLWAGTFLRGGSSRGRRVEAELRVVAAGQLDRARGREHRRGGLPGQLRDRLADGLVTDRARVVVDQERAERRHHLEHAREALLADQELEGPDARVHLDADLLAEFHR